MKKIERKGDAETMKSNRSKDVVRALGVGLSLVLLLAVGTAVAQSADKPEASRLDPVSLEQIKLLDGKMMAQQKDREWAVEAEGGLKRAFRLDADKKREWKEALQLEKEPSLGLDKVDCRSTLCRMEISFGDVGERENAMRMVLDAMPWSGETFGYVDGPESTKAVVFLAKPGQALPRREVKGAQ